MTDERTYDLPGAGTDETETDPEKRDPATSDQPNPWFKEGSDAPDAADIEDPDEQR
jgi:hypothetical protein